MDGTYSYRDNIRSFFQPIEMPGGYTWSQAATLKRIDLYYNGQFESGAYDRRGWKKFFYNITKAPCDIARKFIDLDTKNIVLFHQMFNQEWKVWLMQHELKQWLKENKFGVLLNKIGFNFPKYGHVVLEKQNGKWDLANIQNFRNDQTARSLAEGQFVYQLHRMNESQIKKMSSWNEDKVKELLGAGLGTYDIYRCYERDGDGWKMTIRGRVFDYLLNGQLYHGTEANINRENNYLDGIELYTTHIKNLSEVYRELKWEDVPGRWLGMGYPEYLFDDQIAENEAENLERRGLYFTALHLFQTKDDTIGKNVLTDVENGDILRVMSEVTPVQTEERNLPAFNATRQRWAMSAERKTFTADITRGAELPSRTPLGVANLSAQQVESHYDLKREEFGFFVKDLLLEEIMPEFKSKTKKAHQIVLRSGAEGVEKFLRFVAKTQVDRAAIDYALGSGNGFLPDAQSRAEEEERIVQELKTRRGLVVDVPEGFYEDALYGMDINVTGEQLDTGSLSQTLTVAMQLIASNPAILANPATRSALFKMLELQGVSPIDLNLIAEQAEMQPQMPLTQGGSVGVPTQGRQPVMSQGRTQL